MRSAAIGVSVHSGWGVLVAVSGTQGTEIADRRKAVIINPKDAGVKQPYHHVEEMDLPAAERHLAKCAAESKRLAREAVSQTATELRDRGFSLVASSILLSSARTLPELDQILSSHALIHTAEGEFFRHAFRHAFERLEIPVTGIRERELDDYAAKVFGKATGAVRKQIDGMGRSLGPLWTQDEKTAALAAAIVLAEYETACGRDSKVHVTPTQGA